MVLLSGFQRCTLMGRDRKGFVCAPCTQGEELACVGGVVAVRPDHGQQADVRGNDLIAQDGGFTAGCTHEQWPPFMFTHSL